MFCCVCCACALARFGSRAFCLSLLQLRWLAQRRSLWSACGLLATLLIAPPRDDDRSLTAAAAIHNKQDLTLCAVTGMVDEFVTLGDADGVQPRPVRAGAVVLGSAASAAEEM